MFSNAFKSAGLEFFSCRIYTAAFGLLNLIIERWGRVRCAFPLQRAS